MFVCLCRTSLSKALNPNLIGSYFEAVILTNTSSKLSQSSLSQHFFSSQTIIHQKDGALTAFNDLFFLVKGHD